MTLFNPVNSLTTLLGNYDFNNVNTDVVGDPLTDDMQIMTFFDYEKTGLTDFDNGYFLINNWEKGKDSLNGGAYRNELWVLNCSLNFSYGDITVLDAMQVEIDDVFNTNNTTVVGADIYEMRPLNRGNFSDGVVEFIIEITRIVVSVKPR